MIVLALEFRRSILSSAASSRAACAFLPFSPFAAIAEQLPRQQDVLRPRGCRRAAQKASGQVQPRAGASPAPASLRVAQCATGDRDGRSWSQRAPRAMPRAQGPARRTEPCSSSQTDALAHPPDDAAPYRGARWSSWSAVISEWRRSRIRHPASGMPLSAQACRPSAASIFDATPSSAAVELYVH